MSYKIAIGSSDGINTDLKFGEVEEFLVYEVEKDKFRLAEKRIYFSFIGYIKILNNY